MTDKEFTPGVSLEDPGTPDDCVPRLRLKGRRSNRCRKLGKVYAQAPKQGQARIDWWLGWYDVQLERFYR